MKNLWQRDSLHVRAEIAWAYELNVGVLDRNVVAHGTLGDHNDARRAMAADIVRHRRCRAREVRFGNDFRRTFWVGKHDDARGSFAEGTNVRCSEALMDLATALPRDDLNPGLLGDVLCQILVR